MKKRTVILLLFLVSALLMAACNDSNLKPSKKAVSCAKSAIEVANQYLDRELDYIGAIDQLGKLLDDMEYVDDLSDDDENKAADFAIQCDILILITSITTDNLENDSDSYSDVEEAIGSLKKDIK